MDDKELLIYLDGLAEQGSNPFIESEYQERLNQLAQQQQQLQQLFYRMGCPDSLRIGEYQAGLLTGEPRNQFEQHLTICPHCSRELATMRRFIAQVGPDLKEALFAPPAAAGRPRLVARLLSPAALSVRGGAEDGPLVYEADDFQVTIEVMADVTRPGHKTLFGLIVAAFPAGWQVELSQQGQLVATTISDELGNFEFEGVKTGSYDWAVIRPELEITLPLLTI